jgi:hypothetical protein
VNKFQLIAFNVLAFGFEISNLTGDKFLASRCN